MPDGSWSFQFGGKAPEPELPEGSQETLPYLASADRWEQYNNETVYTLDSLVRQWIATMAKSKAWCNSAKKRRYTMSMVFEQIYGRKYDSTKDAKIVKPLTSILAYYSTRVQKSGSINGKTYTKTIYTISQRRLGKPPYSLKLRLEWLSERGELPTWRGMALPKDDLKPGHARNPKTEANMERRREAGKARYNERYKYRDH